MPPTTKSQPTDPSIAPELDSLEQLAAAIDACHGCPLWERATHAVPGAGPAHGKLMFVGEQPGDQEDLAGVPFVGPAGKLLDKALVEAGIARDEVFVTNAVKHFSWTPRGTRRLHKTPTEREITACMGWLEGEIRLLRPAVVVCLGATAVRAVLGPGVKVLVNRGRFFKTDLAARVLITVHPSSILRGAPEDRERAFAQFVQDLAHIKEAL